MYTSNAETAIFVRRNRELGEKIDISDKGLRSSVYRQMLDKLISCEYRPGSLLNEAQLAEEYQVSRTPIREAINRLEQQGYLRVMPKKGIYVNDISIQDVLQVFQCRIELEPLALKLAVNRLDVAVLLELKQKYIHSGDLDYLSHYYIDMEMHHYFVNQCGNRYIIEMMDRVLNDNLRITIASKQDNNLVHDANEEHIKILESLIKQEPVEIAMDLLEKHLRICCMVAMDHIHSIGKL